MNRFSIFAVAMLAGSLIATSAWAQAPGPDKRVGAEISATLALNMCADDGDSECGGDQGKLGASAASQLSVGYRFMPNVGAYLDMNFSMLSVEIDGVPDGVDTSFTSLAVMPTVRVFMPLANMDTWVGLGAGHQSSAVVMEGMGQKIETSRSNTLDAKIELGTAFFLSERLSVGATFQMLFLVNGAGEHCSSGIMGSEERCVDAPSDSESFDMIQLGAVLRYRL